VFLLFVGPGQQLVVKGDGKAGRDRKREVSSEIDRYRKGREKEPVAAPAEVKFNPPAALERKVEERDVDVIICREIRLEPRETPEGGTAPRKGISAEKTGGRSETGKSAVLRSAGER